LTYGNVTIADLSQWRTEPKEEGYNGTWMDAAWSYGTEAMAYPEFPLGSEQTDLSSLAGTPLYVGDNFYEYRFVNRNPDHLYAQYLISSRKVEARASCLKLETEGGINDTANPMYIKGRVCRAKIRAVVMRLTRTDSRRSLGGISNHRVHRRLGDVDRLH
jgi:hypothetical protein